MAQVVVETDIGAPITCVFDLARRLSVHAQTTRWTKERVLEPFGKDLLDLGDIVTFEAVHFGIRQRLTAQITEFRCPDYFVDVMISGAFASLTHRHGFTALSDGRTRMQDTLDFTAPLGPLGRLAERLFLARYLRSFLVRRNAHLKQIAEETHV